MTARTAWWSVPGMRTRRAAWTVLPARPDQHVVQPHDRGRPAVREPLAVWVGVQVPGHRPGEPGPCPPRGVRAVDETGGEQLAERPVIPAGVEVTHHHLGPGALGRGTGRGGPAPRVPRSRWGRPGGPRSHDRPSGGRFGPGPWRGASGPRTGGSGVSGQRAHRPSPGKQDADKGGCGAARRPARPRPAGAPVPGQFLDGQHVHRVLPQHPQQGGASAEPPASSASAPAR